MRIAACVVTYNRKEKLNICIEHLLNQTAIKFLDIYIVDNASTDGTRESLNNYIKEGKISYYNTGKNLGGAGGFNFAIKETAKKADYLWLMDDDTYPSKTALEELLIGAKKLKGRFGFLSSYAIWTDGAQCLMNIQQMNKKECRKFAAKYPEISESIIPVQNASFVSLFLKSSCVKEVGLPISEFFLWGDDAEYTQRLKQYGGFLIKESVVTHAMDINNGIDIVHNPIERMRRFSICVRNRVYTAWHSGNPIEIVKVYVSPIIKCGLIILKAKDHKAERIGLILKGLKMSLTFHPQIEYLD